MKIWSLALGSILVAIASVHAAGLEVQLEKIAEASAPVTLGEPVVVGGATFYYGVTGGASPGLYRNGSLVVGSGGMISGNEVGNPSVSGGDGFSALVVAPSNYAAPTPDNFYNTINTISGTGFPVRILSRNTTFPGYPNPPHPANPIGPGTIHGSEVAFLIREAPLASPRLPSSIALVPSGGGAVSVIVKEGDPIPNSGGTFSVFDSFTYPYIHNGTVVFTGRSATRRGIYEWAAGSLSVVVDSTMSRPEGGTFSATTFGLEPVKAGQEYAFMGGSVLYRKKNGQIGLVANNQTPVPGGTGNFSTYTAPTFSNGRLAFLASRGSDEFGLYLDLDGAITPIVDKRTNFGGKVPTAFGIARSGAWAGDNSIAFRVTFSDSSTAVYKATFQTAPGRLESLVVFNGPRSGTITVLSKTGYSGSSSKIGDMRHGCHHVPYVS
jgi:hypothetical protein